MNKIQTPIKHICLFDWDIISITYFGVDQIYQLNNNDLNRKFTFTHKNHDCALSIHLFNIAHAENMEIKFNSITKITINEHIHEEYIENEYIFNYKIEFEDITIYILGNGFSKNKTGA